MSCEYDKKRLEEYAAGILDGEEQLEVESHIRSCGACRAESARLQYAALMLEQAFEEEAPSWLPQKTVSVLKSKPKRSFSWFAWGLPALAGAVAAVLLLVAAPEFKSRLGPGAGAMRVSEAAKEDHTTITKDSRTISAGVAHPCATIADEFAVNLENPVNDRSIYEDLGVTPKVAKLLL